MFSEVQVRISIIFLFVTSLQNSDGDRVGESDCCPVLLFAIKKVLLSTQIEINEF